MKPSDLKIPFKFEDRRPIILNRLLFVPSNYDLHHEFLEKIQFEKKSPIAIEYCSGNGQWIIQKAIENPSINFIAVEMRFDRARQIWTKMHNNNLKNLFVVLSEALTFSKYYLEENSISTIYVNFPDPWPKKKHAKNRLIKSDFLDEIAKILKKDAEAIFVTDHEDYSDQMLQTSLNHESFKPFYQKPYFVSDIPGYGTSYFDSLFRKKGCKIFYLKILKS